jgi:hypothetical protein
MKVILCANCTSPTTLTRVSHDTRNPVQQVLTCTHCGLIEIRAPQPGPAQHPPMPCKPAVSQEPCADRPAKATNYAGER